MIDTALSLSNNQRVTLEIPDAFVTNIRRIEPLRSRSWLEGLPERVHALCHQWSLTIDGATMHGGLSLVVPVRRASEAFVLRVAWPHGATAEEIIALRAWDGRGAVRLLEADLSADALLLERLDGGRALKTLPLEPAFEVMGALLRRLAIDAPDGIPRLSNHASSLAAEFRARWETCGRPFSERLVETVIDAARELGPRAANCLVHYDLYDDNVLAATREPWLAIDPKTFAGDVEFGLAQMLWRRLEDIDGAAGFWRAWQTLLTASGADAERARGWTLVRVADYWLWGLGIGLTIDPGRCETIAAWLL